ncbi:MAG: carboxylate-amine ligase [Rhodospirillaceae bacterium]|nr:carboxylate-amine ligase [Rhodospirillaceae bacterium]MBL6930797.1 carboxylate-amine ligase [Rhodospirillales bacterium]
MSENEPSFTIGIEEEYLLVDPKTRDLADEPPQELWTECEKRLGDLIKPEFLKSQIEVATGICNTIADGREDLGRLRKTVAEVAGKHGLAPIAASTHPFSQWQAQQHTDKERYHVLAQDMQAVARRLLICGMHVHVGLNDDELRIDLMNQASYFLPHILALSTSSPFWQGTDTGLKSYRLSVFDELPRTGLPERFDSYAEYQRHVNVLTKAGTIKDASMLWWDIRPSTAFPTLEMRITDVCTRLEDTCSIAALFQCIIRMLYRLRRDNQRWRMYANMLINENRWRAQRYGLDDGLLDFGKETMVPSADLIDELIDMVAEDAEALKCSAEIKRLREIVEHGTSAHRQRAVYYQSIESGMTSQDSLAAVVDMLIAETVMGL